MPIVPEYVWTSASKDIIRTYFDLSGDLRYRKNRQSLMDSARHTQISLIQTHLFEMDDETRARAFNCMAHLEAQIQGEDRPANWFLCKPGGMWKGGDQRP